MIGALALRLASWAGPAFVGLQIFCLAAAGPVGEVAWAARDEVYYAPEDAPADRVVALYARARRYVYVAVYGLTYPPAVKALISAKRRGLDVRVITDHATSVKAREKFLAMWKDDLRYAAWK
jgi:phosphatidylserine/phosphatidylglycerophosphate/cardiolipin synthase-like enzyme